MNTRRSLGLLVAFFALGVNAYLMVLM